MSIFTNFAAACGHGSFLTFNHSWYSYLPSTSVNGICTPQISNIGDVWLIVAAVIEILLRIAALAAVGFVIYGGYGYLTSQGQPDKTSRARQTIINALAGLAIAILSAGIVDLIAKNVN